MEDSTNGPEDQVNTGTVSFSINTTFMQAWDRARTHKLDGSGHLIGGGYLRRGRAHSCIGEPGAGKTVLLVHENLCLATGESFFGRPVEKCRTVFFACEAGESTLDRFVLAAKLRGLVWPVKGLFVVPMALDLKNNNHRNNAMNIIEQARADVFYIDTANASGSGAEDNKDMPEYVASLSDIIAKTRAAAVINHHTPVSNGQRERGHTSFRGMLDLSRVVTKGPTGEVVISFGKARDSEADEFGRFTIHGHPMGVTNLGEPLTIPFLKESEGAPAEPTKKKTESVKDKVWALVQSMARSGQVSRDAVRDAYIRTRPGQNPDNQRRACDRALTDLQAGWKD